MDVVCGLVGKFCDLMIDLSWEKFLYLIYYHRNIDKLNQQLVELGFERSSLQHRMDEAENNGEQIEEKVHYWLGKVDELLEQVHKFHEESQAKAECNITSCPNPWLRYKLSKRAKVITKEFDKIYAKRIVGKISYRGPLPSIVELINREGNEGIDSRVPIMNQILEELRNGVNMIGLCGLGGVGKTTIAKEVAQNHKIFKKVIMTTISQELNIEKIQGEIAEKLSMRLTENNKEVRAFRLCERLKKEKNMLLILDDLWEELDLGEVGIPFVSFENEGCKILLTSRNKMLLSGPMKCQKIVEVGVLSENEALELFKKIAELSTDSSSPELISIASDIVRKCGGLPLAIVTIAKALSNKDINEWQDALARLNNPFRVNMLSRKVDEILKWSYDRLNSSEYKNIFLLVAMLSHDPSIEELLMYSVGLDILDGIENMEDSYIRVSAIVRKLKSLNLFLDSVSSHHVTIHDVFRDFALPIASNELHAFIRSWYKEWPDENMLQGFEGICLQESNISDLPEELLCPRLQFFLLNSTEHDLNIPNMFFKSLKELKVLAITKVNFSSLPSLSFLQKLKALCLHSCLLEDITEIKSLRKLKVLSLAYSEIQRLPVEVAELTSLQMLNLSHCSKLKVIPQKLLSNLKKLEILYMANSFNQWKVKGSSEADENASLDELMDLPISSLEIHIPILSMLPENLFLKMNLRRYRIFIGERWTWQSNCGASKILKLELESSIDLTAGLRNLSKGVEDLHLYGSNGQENVLYNLDASGFPCLRHLRIKSNDDIKYVVLNSAHHEDAFAILESLKLKNMKALENLCEGPNDIVFRQLHTLKMENLPALTGDFSIKDRATKNTSNKIFKSLFNKVSLPKLEILKLSNLNSLIPLIWEDQLLHNSFNSLKTLRVKSSGFVKLVPLHVLESLNNLEELDVDDCDMMEIVFDFEDLNEYYKEIDSSSVVVVPLKKLKLRNLPKLKNVWSDHYQGNVSFPSLMSVDVSYCKSLTSIFPEAIAKGMLCDLEELQIRQCGVDVIVAKDQVSGSVAVTFGLPRLTSLLVSGLPNLRNFYPQKHTLEWPHLNRLSIQCCDELQIFEKQVLGSSEIYEEENMLDSKYPLLSHVKVIGNLERLTLQGKEVKEIGSGQFPMYQFPKLKLLHLSLEKEPSFTFSERSPNLGELKLSGDFEKALGGDNVAALVACFPKLTLENISIMGSLSPSLVSSPNLTHLNVNWCHEWTTLMTSSIARSLVHLKHLSISNCPKMEEIITKKEREDDEDKEIFFSKLEFLELTHLPSLRRFCRHNYTFKFLLLDQLLIKECPKFKTFSPGLINTPSLTSVQLVEDWKDVEIWDTDLNKTIYRQRYMTSRNKVLDEDDAIMIRNGQFSTYYCPQVEILQIKGFVEEWVTFPYTLLERFPKLNELHVKNSSFEEIFPSHAPPSTSFLNLTVFKVSKCHQLVYLVTTSTAKSLVNLETLKLDDCEKLEEIVRNDIDKDVEEGITFNGLRILKLIHLPRLKTQEDKRDFNTEDRATNIKCTNIPRSLSSHNKVLLPKLEILELSYLNSLIPLIWDDQLLHNSFNNLKTLTVEKCGFVKLVPLHVLKSLNNLEELDVQDCDMLEIVFDFEDLNDYDKEMDPSSVVVPLKKLKLRNLPKLKNVWIDHYRGNVCFPSLRSVYVSYCESLRSIFPESIAKGMLCDLKELEICDCGVDLIVAKGQVSESVAVTFVLPRLTFLVLYGLPNLRNFYPQKHTLEWPYLQRLSTRECDELEIFEKEVSGSSEIYEEESTLNSKYHLFSHDKVLLPELEILELSNLNSLIPLIWDDQLLHNSFNNLKTLKVEKCGFVKLVPLHVLKSLNNLEEVDVEDCDMLEIVFDFEDLNDYHKEMDSLSVVVPLKMLKLRDLPKLKNVWSNNCQGNVSFPSLRSVSVYNCESLTSIFPASIAKGMLCDLEELEICHCGVDVIVANDQDSESVAVTFGFPRLTSLNLSGLPNLRNTLTTNLFNVVMN